MHGKCRLASYPAMHVFQYSINGGYIVDFNRLSFCHLQVATTIACTYAYTAAACIILDTMQCHGD